MKRRTNKVCQSGHAVNSVTEERWMCHGLIKQFQECGFNGQAWNVSLITRLTPYKNTTTMSRVHFFVKLSEWVKARQSLQESSFAFNKRLNIEIQWGIVLLTMWRMWTSPKWKTFNDFEQWHIFQPTVSHIEGVCRYVICVNCSVVDWDLSRCLEICRL